MPDTSGRPPSPVDQRPPDGAGEAASSAGERDAGFDQVVERLRTVVERLETGSLGLEQSLAAFEEGVRLSRRGSELLDRAERRVEILLRGPEGDRVVPFPAGEPGEGKGSSKAGAVPDRGGTGQGDGA